MDELAGYRILRRLGEGGMGVVYLAEKTEPFVRQVALKVMHASLGSETARLRFRLEQEMLARLTHPNIAQIYEAGTAADGAPFFVMELVEGRRIAEYCASQKLSVEARLKLFLQVCSAVHFAHQRGVLHRDLKPSNILLQENVREPTVKLIDFGIAKALDQLQDDEPERGYLGTPAYMAPESFEPELGLDTRSDVYSLGLVLREILTDTNPAGRSVLDAVRPGTDVMMRSGEISPETATVVLSDAQAPVEHAHPVLRGDLEAIVRKATARKRVDRYASVDGLEEDVRRYLNGFPVRAQPQTPIYRLRKMVGRHRVAFGAGALVLVASVAGATASALEARRANREARSSAELSEFLVELFEVADPSEARGRSITAKEVLDRGAARIRDELATTPAVRARMAVTIGTVYRSLGLFRDARPVLELAVSLQESHAPDSVGHAEALVALGRLVTEMQVDHELGKRSFDRALTIYAGRFGDESPEWAVAAAYAADQRQGAGDFEGASELGRRAARVLRAFPEHQAVGAFALGTYASVESRAGRHDSALAALREALTLAREAPEPELALTASLLNDLSVAQSRAGDQAAAIETTEELLEVDRKIFGEDHAWVASDMHNLAMMLYLQDRADESLPLLEVALAKRAAALGEENPAIGEMQKDIGLVQLRLGDLAAAQQRIERAIAIMNATVGPRHYRTGIVLTAAAKLARAKGELQSAVSTMKAAREVLLEALGEESPRIVQADEFIAEVESAIQVAGVD